MKKKGIIMSLVLAVVTIFTMGFATACDNRPVIAVVAKGESHAFWQSVKRGAEAAGENYGYRITFRGPKSESASDLDSQKQMVQSALSNNPKGMVIATIGTGFVDLLTQAKDKGIPVAQFDSGIWAADKDAIDKAGKNPIISSVATSNLLASALAAEDFFEYLKVDIAAATTANPYVIGVIQHDQSQTGIDRAKGFTDKMTSLIAADETTKGKATIVPEVCDGDGGTVPAYKLALEKLTGSAIGAKAVFMCNEGVVKQVSDAIGASSGQYDAIKFYGFDAGTKQIDWMKKTSGPKLYGAVAQDSYRIGYDAVEQVAKAIAGETVTENVAIGGKVWNKENLDQMIDEGFVYEG